MTWHQFFVVGAVLSTGGVENRKTQIGRIVSFLTLSSSKPEDVSQNLMLSSPKPEDVSQNSFVFKLADRQVDRQTDREIDRQTDRQTERWIDR